MTEHGICAKCKKSVGCPYADDRITGCKNFVLEPELKLTSKEWLRTATTEQLAEFLYDIAYLDNWSDAIMNDSLINETAVEDAIEKWLKQPHTKE